MARRELVPSMATAEPLLLLRCFGERRKQRKQEGKCGAGGGSRTRAEASIAELRPDVAWPVRPSATRGATRR